VLENPQINDGTKVVNIGEEDDLNTPIKELVKDTRVVERLKDVAMTGRVPVANRRVKVLGDGKERILVDSGVSRLVEGNDLDAMAVILLDDVFGVVIRVERVHEEEGDVDAICFVEELNLADGKIEERHSVTDLDDRLGADAAHGSTKTTIELENGELVQELNGVRVGKVLVLDDLALRGRVDAIPITM